MATLTQRPLSILRNPSPAASPYNPPPSLPSSPRIPSSILSSSSSSSVDDDLPPLRKYSRSPSIPGGTRIRFAPLPVPDQLLDPRSQSRPSSPPPPHTPLACDVQAPVALPEPEDTRTPTIRDVTPPASSDILPPSPYPSSLASKPTISFSKRLWRPLFKSRNKSLSDVPAADDASLFRVSSRESTRSAGGSIRTKGYSFGSPLSLWTSTGSVSSYVSDSGRPLSRRPKSPSSLSSFPPLRTRTDSASQKHPSAKPGIRMLNGRIYGRRRPFSQSSTNPFANVRDQEPEFVEWGYGGMGSNKTNDHTGANGRWKAVQGAGNTSAFSGSRNAGGDDEDASGMAWVKRRREERERLRKEQEEKERKLAQVNSVTKSDDAALRKDTPVTERDEDARDNPKGGEDTPKSQLVSLPHGWPTQDSVEQVYTAVTLPPTPHKHYHTPKHESSIYRTPIIQTPSTEDSQDLSVVGILELDLGQIPTNNDISSEVGKDLGRARPTSSGSTSEEDNSSLMDDEDDVDDEDSDTDSAGENLEATRKTALGAGVEKISRHKDHHETGPAAVPVTSSNAGPSPS